MKETIETIERIVIRLQRHQQALALSDNQFCNRYGAYVGSYRTWTSRFLAKDYRDLDLAKWEKKLLKLVSILDGGSEVIVSVHQELTFFKKATALATLLECQTTDRRNCYMLAPTGIGKSIFGRHKAASDPRNYVYYRCPETCRDSPGTIYRGLARALGCDVKNSKANTQESLCGFLQGNPITVIIDEAHEGGIPLMKCIKTLIDETPARFIQLAYPTDYDRVLVATHGALHEAKQLLGRTLKPVFDDYRDGVRTSDIALYLQCEAGLQEESRTLAERIRPMIVANGNLRVLKDAIDEARAEIDSEDAPVPMSVLLRALDALCPVRKTNEFPSPKAMG